MSPNSQRSNPLDSMGRIGIRASTLAHLELTDQVQLASLALRQQISTLHTDKGGDGTQAVILSDLLDRMRDTDLSRAFFGDYSARLRSFELALDSSEDKLQESNSHAHVTSFSLVKFITERSLPKCLSEEGMISVRNLNSCTIEIFDLEKTILAFRRFSRKIDKDISDLMIKKFMPSCLEEAKKEFFEDYLNSRQGVEDYLKAAVSRKEIVPEYMRVYFNYEEDKDPPIPPAQLRKEHDDISDKLHQHLLERWEKSLDMIALSKIQARAHGLAVRKTDQDDSDKIYRLKEKKRSSQFNFSMLDSTRRNLKIDNSGNVTGRLGNGAKLFGFARIEELNSYNSEEAEYKLVLPLSSFIDGSSSRGYIGTKMPTFHLNYSFAIQKDFNPSMCKRGEVPPVVVTIIDIDSSNPRLKLEGLLAGIKGLK